jgi:enoyl-CoA hydratase/carnithine racemase
VALACDLRVARRGAGKIGLPEVGLGVLPGTGGTQRLARLVGAAKALELMVTGVTFTFDEALPLGLVTQILEPDDFDARVLEFARRFCPPHKASKAVGRIKRAVVTGSGLPLAEALALERELQQQLFESEDAKEGLAAYVEKRPPRFRGR